MYSSPRSILSRAWSAQRFAYTARLRIERGELYMRGLLDDVRVRVLGPEVLAPYDDKSVFLNVNTPHDYARATGRVELDEKPYKDRITE